MSKPKMIVNKDTTEITLNKIEAQRTLFVLIAIVSFIIPLKWYIFLYGFAIWQMMIYLLNDGLSKYVKVSKVK